MMRARTSIPVRLAAWRAALAVLLVSTGIPSLAAQQAPAGVLGGFSRDGGPIDITSDKLTINDQTKLAIYKGNVVAVQGDHTLRAPELEVIYVSRDPNGEEQSGQKGENGQNGEKAAKPPRAANVGEESQQIKRIKAKQKVVMTSTTPGREPQTATCDDADYDVTGQMVTLIGNVHITQGKNIITGSKVTLNLATSEYTVEGAPDAVPAAGAAAKPGRITTTLFPQGKTEAKATPAPTAAAGPAAPPTPAPKQPSASSWTATTSPPR